LPGNGVPFWGIWYLGGMLIPAVLGWLFGPALCAGKPALPLALPSTPLRGA